MVKVFFKAKFSHYYFLIVVIEDNGVLCVYMFKLDCQQD